MTTFWEQFPPDRLLAEISLWSARLPFLAADMERIEPYADIYHIDVADAHFVPGLLFFPDLVAALRPLSSKPFHVHLMVANPLALIDDFISAGADLISVHCENGDQTLPSLQRIRAAGIRAGLALQLETSPEAAIPYFEQIDLITMMGTKLGIKGVGLDETACPRISQIQRLIAAYGRSHQIKVAADGGIRANTVPALREAGADTVVMGSLAFKSNSLAETFHWLHALPRQDRAV